MNFSVDGALEDMQSRLQTLVASRFFAPAVNGVALLVLAAGMAGWTWKLIRPPTAPAPSSAMQGAAPRQAPAFDVQALLSANLFGEAAPAAGSGDPMNAPVSSLNLVLTGIIAAAGESYALISVNGAAQEPFAIGDEVTAGAVLDAVYADRVILIRGGVSESLILEGMPPPIDVAVPTPPQTQAPAGEKYSEIIRNTPNQFYVPRNLITEQLKKPQELLTQAMMVPNADGGYLIREVQPGGAFEKLGLQVGDVVRAVNGQPLNSVNDAMRMYQQLRFLRAVRVDVTRGGQPETLQYNIN